MCGIVGVLHSNQSPVSHEMVMAMTTALSHRGPDGWGMELRNEVGPGHRRLAMIMYDLATSMPSHSNENVQVRAISSPSYLNNNFLYIINTSIFRNMVKKITNEIAKAIIFTISSQTSR